MCLVMLMLQTEYLIFQPLCSRLTLAFCFVGRFESNPSSSESESGSDEEGKSKHKEKETKKKSPEKKRKSSEPSTSKAPKKKAKVAVRCFSGTCFGTNVWLINRA